MKDYLQNLNLHQVRKNIETYSYKTASAVLAGSVLSFGDPRGLIAGIIVKDIFQKLNWKAATELTQKFGYNSLITPNKLFAIEVANVALSIIIGRQVAEAIGFKPSYFGMMSGMLCSAILHSYLDSKKDIFEEAHKVTQSNQTKESQNTVITVTEANFDQHVTETKGIVVLDAYANWCPPCRRVAPIFLELSKELSGKIKFVKLNVNEENALAGKLGIKGMPTFLFFKDGKQVDSDVGFLDREALLSKINPLLATGEKVPAPHLSEAVQAA